MCYISSWVGSYLQNSGWILGKWTLAEFWVKVFFQHFAGLDCALPLVATGPSSQSAKHEHLQQHGKQLHPKSFWLPNPKMRWNRRICSTEAKVSESWNTDRNGQKKKRQWLLNSNVSQLKVEIGWKNELLVELWCRIPKRLASCLTSGARCPHEMIRQLCTIDPVNSEYFANLQNLKQSASYI